MQVGCVRHLTVYLGGLLIKSPSTCSRFLICKGLAFCGWIYVDNWEFIGYTYTPTYTFFFLSVKLGQVKFMPSSGDQSLSLNICKIQEERLLSIIPQLYIINCSKG